MCEEVISDNETENNQLTNEQKRINHEVGELLRDTNAFDKINNRMKSIIKTYPPRQYLGQSEWSEEDIDERRQLAWEIISRRGLYKFWTMSRAGKLNFPQAYLTRLLLKVLLKMGPPSCRDFYTQVVEQIRKDPRFAKKTWEHLKLIGLAEWKDKDIKVYEKSREDLWEYWKNNIDFPSMAGGQTIKASERRELFYQMFAIIEKWILEADFYGGFAELVQFPFPRNIGEGNVNDSSESSNDNEFDRTLYQTDSSQFNINQFQKVQKILLENHKTWTREFRRVLKDYSDVEKSFLYYYYVDGYNQSAAAREVGKTPSFATNFLRRLANDFSCFKEIVAEDEQPALGKFITAYLLKSRLRGKKQ